MGGPSGRIKKKRTKYEELVIDCCKQDWKARCMPIEVGCRGFEGQ